MVSDPSFAFFCGPSKRVMPSCIFVLSRFFLRVDGVVFRVLDVRLFIDLATNHVIREVKGKQMAYHEVKSVSISHCQIWMLNDPIRLMCFRVLYSACHWSGHMTCPHSRILIGLRMCSGCFKEMIPLTPLQRQPQPRPGVPGDRS